MRRLAVLALVILAGSLGVVVKGFQAPPPAPSADDLVVEKLRDNYFMIRTGKVFSGGNTGVFVGTTGVVIVDTKVPGWGQPLIAKIRALTPKPVTTIINTHSHFDHVSGNVDFPATVEVVTQENTRTNMTKMAQISGQSTPQPNVFTGANASRMPTKTFKETLSLGQGADRVDLYYFGRGHTNGDAWVVFPALRLAHIGDLFPGKSLVLLDANNGGSGVAIPETLSAGTTKLGGSVDTFITGHSTAMTVADVKEYAEFNRDFLATVRDGKRAGKSVDDVAQSWKLPPKYMGYAAPAPAGVTRNVQVIFDELK